MDATTVNILLEKYTKPIFPLQTIQNMADRWGVSKQVINNWKERRDDFPKPIEGFMKAKTPTVYPLYEVVRYEKVRRL